MTKFKVDDQVLYKRAGLRGRITGKPSLSLWAVLLEDKSNRYCFESELELIEPLKEAEGCMYCKHGEPLNDTANSDLTVNIYQDGGEHILGCDYDNGESATDCTGTVIHYCPMCGRKLEVAE
ncbi:hypothetical protein [Enterococcus dispar]|uniref:hypothetical protein n=1 Tax=Enterococcus dispar TaxID=44009 RepID=UPI00189F5807|nr:hypothetical protein [Enterococcus dispar]